METKVKELVAKVYGPKYREAGAVKVSSDAAGKLRKIAASMGPDYAEALERAIRDKAVQVNFADSWLDDQAVKLTEGMVYISEEGDFAVDWLAEEIADFDGETAGVAASSGDDEDGDDWLAREL